MLLSFKGIKPRVAETAFVAPDATLVGDVTVGDQASIWFGARLRGDMGPIVVGARSNIQDNVIIHLEIDGRTVIEEDVTVAHGAVLHNCTLKRGCLVGMNAVVLDNSVVGEGAMIAAGSVVVPGSEIPPGCLAVGIPARPKKELSGGSLNWVDKSADAYVRLAESYLREGTGRVFSPEG